MAEQLAGTVPDGQATGQAGQVPQGQGEKPAGNAQPPAPLTLEQVQEAINQALADREQRSSRALQSQLDKREANILKRIEGIKQQQARIVAGAKATGVDPAQAAALGQNLMNEEIAAILDEQRLAEQQATQQQQQQQGQPNEAQQVTAYAESLIETLGLSEDDPELLEAYKVMRKATNAQQYIEAVKGAYQAKVKRELSQTPGDTTRQQATPARMPGLGADGGQRAVTNPIKDITNPTQLYKLAAQKQQG